MALFNKTQQQMVLDLLISENPGLAGVVLGTHVEFVGKPTVASTTATVKLRGKRGAGFTGVKAFSYTLLHLGTLFANTKITIQQYVATSSQDLIPAINAKYGLNLIAAETVAYGIAASATSATLTITINASVGSYVYQPNGAVSCAWTRGVQQLTDYYPNRSLTALTVPDVMLKAFQQDCTDMVPVLEDYDTSAPFDGGSVVASEIVRLLGEKIGLPLTLSPTATPGTGLYDMSGFTLSFTTPDVVQDSRPDFRKIAILTPPAVYGNQYSPIYLHYDKISLISTASIITVTELDGVQAPSNT